ncbi:hypothetical protein M0208_11595 [Sphingomonas sp. SUN019]|uniref:hypothetical protein n=1 Tax=Sphingomonas sp. SUN019 TaxID=2937788 RepID=UPI002164E88B|nr:hypothetical protein [Sphingomonas sp. SUN019]UVO51133.1 hypothetical protein M0208_11595 [Sphingomonas sp. SUN019]
MSIADLAVGEPDGIGSTIRIIYAKKPPEYAVYGTDNRVLVMFADDPARADKQRVRMSRLNPLRGEVNGLVEDWRLKPGSAPRAARYDRCVADALIVGFEGDIAAATALLKSIKQGILDERVATARFEYLVVAFVTGVAVMLAITLANAIAQYGNATVDLLRGGAAGAVGAFFSISLAIRGRTVLPDLQRMANLLDAALRMVIGIIAAVVLIAFIRSGVVSVNIGDAALSGRNAPDWLLVLIYGFVAGFSERFVPDLLAKASATTSAPTAQERVEESAPVAAATDTVVDTEAVEGAVATTVPDDPAPEEAGIDSCACDVDLPDDEVTGDADLPPASGGVALDKAA